VSGRAQLPAASLLHILCICCTIPLMNKADLHTYTQARPYVRGILALLFALRAGQGGMPPGATFEYFFVMADDFLTVFEQRSS
jgi:hypothetical protein